MAEKKPKSPAQVTTGLVRFSYAHVFTPAQIDGEGEEKYSVALLIKKTDKDTLARIAKAVDHLKAEYKAKNGGKLPPKFKEPLRDGDAEKSEDSNYEGCFFLNANSPKTRKPEIVDKDLNPIIEQDEFYSGCYGRASLGFFLFNAKGNIGIGTGLNNLQKLKDGDPLAGGSTAQEDFSDDAPFVDDTDDDLL